MKKSHIISISLIFLLSGCGSMPDLKVGYYLPKSSLSVTVIQTATCHSENLPILVTDVVLEASYQANTQTLHTIDLNKFGRGPTKTDATANFYDDGRLKSINVSQTGEAKELLTTFVKLIPIAFILGFDEKDMIAACEYLKKMAAKEKPLSIIHRGHTSFEKGATGIAHVIEMKQATVPDEAFEKLELIFGQIAATYVLPDQKTAVMHVVDKHKGERLTLIQPERALIKVVVNRPDQKKLVDFTGGAWVPQHGTKYDLPIQKSPWFGQNVFALDLSQSGHVTKIQYTGNRGSAELSGVISEAQTQYKDESLQDDLDKAKAEADLIYQQQRLVKCQADPAECSK